jgi:hypothetical protein
MRKDLKMDFMLCGPCNRFNFGWSAVVAGSALLLTACMGESTTRRSAVDAAKLCNGDNNAVFAGTCLQRGAGVGAPPAGQSGGGEEGQREQERLEQERLEKERLEKERLEQEARNQPPGAVQPAEPVVPEPPKELPRPEVKDPPNPPQGGADGKAAVQLRKIKFTKDSFVAVAQDNVIRNCFIPAESVITFSGELAPLNNFKSLGVKQNVVFKVTEVQYPKNESDTCSLKGEDFLYLDAHAQLM